MDIDYLDFLRDLIINCIAIYTLAFAIFYRRHGSREMAITMILFNIFLFTIVITMAMTEFNLAAGFALFAMLSIISLRSVNISKIEVGYLFGAITLGLINGISFTDYLLLGFCNLVILGGAWIVDSNRIFKPTLFMETTLENITIEDQSGGNAPVQSTAHKHCEIQSR